MGESIVKAIMWGNQSTDMLKTYSHISNDTIMDAVAQRYGIKKPETREEKKLFEPIQCTDCGTVNPPGMRFCGVCMKPLTKEGEEIRGQLEKVPVNDIDPEALAMLLNLSKHPDFKTLMEKFQ